VTAIECKVGDPVFAVGNPRGLEGTLSEGIVSAIRPVGADAVLQISAPISPGSSGGPVLDGSARVIGVAAATLKGGQNLNFAIPSAYVSRLVSGLKAPTPIAAWPFTNQESIVQHLGGTKSTEGVVGSQLEWGNEMMVLTPSRTGIAYSESFTFSIRNELSEAVTKVYCLVVFYDKDGKPVDTYEARLPGPVQPGLAKRVTGEVDWSVKNLAHTVKFRVLDFEVVGASE
jgi:hypothetical protein